MFRCACAKTRLLYFRSEPTVVNRLASLYFIAGFLRAPGTASVLQFSSKTALHCTARHGTVDAVQYCQQCWMLDWQLQADISVISANITGDCRRLQKNRTLRLSVYTVDLVLTLRGGRP